MILPENESFMKDLHICVLLSVMVRETTALNSHFLAIDKKLGENSVYKENNDPAAIMFSRNTNYSLLEEKV